MFLFFFACLCFQICVRFSSFSPFSFHSLWAFPFSFLCQLHSKRFLFSWCVGSGGWAVFASPVITACCRRSNTCHIPWAQLWRSWVLVDHPGVLLLYRLWRPSWQALCITALWRLHWRCWSCSCVAAMLRTLQALFPYSQWHSCAAVWHADSLGLRRSVLPEENYKTYHAVEMWYVEFRMWRVACGVRSVCRSCSLKWIVKVWNVSGLECGVQWLVECGVCRWCSV